MSAEDVLEMIETALDLGVVEIPECGCVVEADGTCEHGNVSPLIEEGAI